MILCRGPGFQGSEFLGFEMEALSFGYHILRGFEGEGLGLRVWGFKGSSGV